MKKLNGINIKHSKHTEKCETVSLPIPKKIKIPLLMNIGAPADPLVKAGDEVFAGQKIADSDAFVSVPVHSSVSGKVIAISDYLLPNGNTCKAVEIEADGKQTYLPGIASPIVNDKPSFLKAVRESGLCGLGGAGFPTHIKLNPKNNVDILIINAAECEPYITSDYRQMLETADSVIGGIQTVMRYVNIKKAIIAVEENKPEAIELFNGLVKNIPEIEVTELPSKYPQGAEKVIIFSATGRIVRAGQIPADTGVIVLNVSTAAFIYNYLLGGVPLIEKRITVDGDAIEKPCNIIAPVGTPVSDILEFTETDITLIKRLVFGGPMMGLSLHSADMPVIKTTNAVLAFKSRINETETACIRCGRCISACPLKLMPVMFANAYTARDADELRRLNVQLCMSCGCCTYVCPAKRKLSETNQLAKALL